MACGNQEHYNKLLFFVQSLTESERPEDDLVGDSELSTMDAYDNGQYDDAFTMGQDQVAAENALCARTILKEIGESYE